MAHVRSDIYGPLLLAVGVLLCEGGQRKVRAQGPGPEFVPGPAPGAVTGEELPGPIPQRRAGPPSGLPGASQLTPSETELVADVRVEGNKSVRLDRITPFIQTRPGRNFSLHTVQEDVRRLMKSRQFVDVRVEYPRGPDGNLVVLFQVVERPTIQYIKYVGNKKLKLRILERESGLKVGQSLDPYTVEEARRKIDEFYRKRGYSKIRISIIEGNHLGDKGVIMVINEGYVQRIADVDFIGNTIASDARLKTQVKSKPPILWIFKGFVEREKIDEDVERLTAYYRSLGFFRARIGRELDWNEKGNWLTLRFVIDEGPRYKLRNININGNTKFNTTDLIGELGLEPGQFFDQPKMTRDILTLKDNYGAHGYVFADVKADPRFLEEPGMLDLVYNIVEGDRYRVARIDVDIEGDHPHTRVSTVLNRISLRPGDIVDVRQLRASERRLKASGLFLNDPQRGIAPSITTVPIDRKTKLASDSTPSVRGQSPEEPQERELVIGVAGRLNPKGVEQKEPPEEVIQPRRVLPLLPNSNPRGVPNRAATQPTVSVPQPTDQSHRKLIPPPPVGGTQGDYVAFRFPKPQDANQAVVRGQYAPGDSGTASPNPNPNFTPGGVYGNPGTPNFAPPPVTNVAPGGGYRQMPAPRTQPAPVRPGVGEQVEVLPGGPDPGLAPNGYAPALPEQPLVPPGGFIQEAPTDNSLVLSTTVQETQTGRFMFGVGVNSDAGLVGSIVLEEQNFDITRVPTSWADIRNGTAFRGAGQQFRIDAVPGSEVQRYSFSFREPYLLNTPISFGISAFLFTRRYEDWDEERLGGRVSLGYQIRPDVAVTFALSAQNVDVKNPRIPTPTEITDVLGDNDLYLARVGLVHDTRDSAFLPTQGFYRELGLEQGFGEYDFPRLTAEARHYFLIHERPDGSGRHVLSARGQVGITGKNTPAFEHFFAGGFSTLRGFDFRGASPVSLGTTVGGDFQVLTGIEYLFPLTADDALRAVLFVDAGTVENRVAIDPDNFRIAPGAGLRITVPGMGPAPIALDLAFPVAQAATDDKQIFSFFVGFLR